MADDSKPDLESIEHQTTFTDDGQLEAEDTDSTLEHFGADVDHREKESKIDRPSASEFGIDDRPSENRRESGEQAKLFASDDENQRTLEGERASDVSTFESETES